MAGDTLKLRETPKASGTKLAPKGAGGQANGLGYGDSSDDATMDDPQPSPSTARAGGEGSETKWVWVGWLPA